VINGDIRLFENRCALELMRCNFIVTRLERNAELEQLVFHVRHVLKNAVLDRAEIMVFQLLAFWRRRTKERASRQQQVRAGLEIVLVDEEIFLLRTEGRENLFRIALEIAQDAKGCIIERLNRAQQWRLRVERMACCCRDARSLVRLRQKASNWKTIISARSRTAFLST
jgi:hypothetical protein